MVNMRPQRQLEPSGLELLALSGMIGISKLCLEIQNLVKKLIGRYRDVVVKAWRNALNIASLVATSLTALAPGSAAYTAFEAETKPACSTLQKDPNTLSAAGRKDYMRCYRIFLAANNLAYGQYFGADPENIGLSTGVPFVTPFEERILTLIKSPQISKL